MLRSEGGQLCRKSEDLIFASEDRIVLYFCTYLFYEYSTKTEARVLPNKGKKGTLFFYLCMIR
jgi:hypothetical protein